MASFVIANELCECGNLLFLNEERTIVAYGEEGIATSQSLLAMTRSPGRDPDVAPLLGMTKEASSAVFILVFF